MGYYLTNTNINSELWDTLDTDNTPEVVIVKKHYARKSKKSKNRKWKLKRMAREHNDIVANDDSRQARQEQRESRKRLRVVLARIRKKMMN